MTAQDTPSARTPGIVRFAVWLTFFNTWVLFEETVVDRYGLWEYMPYYRVGRLCSWDIGAMAKGSRPVPTDQRAPGDLRTTDLPSEFRPPMRQQMRGAPCGSRGKIYHKSATTPAEMSHRHIASGFWTSAAASDTMSAEPG